jgi:hypothetical protein
MTRRVTIGGFWRKAAILMLGEYAVVAIPVQRAGALLCCDAQGYDA